jgi:hypothetical protein
MPGPDASNIAHLRTRVVEPSNTSNTCQQTSNRPDVLKAIKLTHFGTVTIWRLDLCGVHVEEFVPVDEEAYTAKIRSVTVGIDKSQSRGPCILVRSTERQDAALFDLIPGGLRGTSR